MSKDIQMIAAELVGIPYKDGGRDREGLDCYGLVLLFMRELGIELPDWEYERDWAKQGGNLLIENYHEYAEQIGRAYMVPGDVIMFENHPGVANHLGVFLGAGKFIHVVEKAGVVIMRVNSQPHLRRMHSCYRMKRKQ